MNYITTNFEEYNRNIINRILMLLDQKNMKQLDLASRSSIGQSSLSKILRGEMRLTLHHIYKICIALNIAPEELLALNQEPAIPSENSCFAVYEEQGLFNEQYMNEQVLIRDKNHPAFQGYKNNTFHLYLYPTITTESFLLEGTITFDTESTPFCKTDLTLNTGKLDASGDPILKHYFGELVISLTMGACYCVLTNPDIGEICFLNFKHMFLFNRELECRVGTISSSSSGGNRLPVIQRVLISQHPLHVNKDNASDLEFVQGQLRLNNSTILISEADIEELEKKYKNQSALSEFFHKFKETADPEPYYLLDEANMKNVPLTSDIKTEGLGILRNSSSSLRYNKVSTKTDENVFEYICNRIHES